MVSPSEVVGSIPKDGTLADSTTANASRQSKKPKAKVKPVAPSEKPVRVLPTDRIGFQKQLNILRAFAAVASQGNKLVTNPEAAKLAQLHPSTTLLALPFFADVGLLEKQGAGYVPAPEVIAFHRAHSWSPEKAPEKLAPLLRKTWFAQALVPNLQMKAIRERDAINELGSLAAAGPKHQTQVRMLLDYLQVSGVVRRDGDLLKDAGGGHGQDGEVQPLAKQDATGRSEQVVTEQPRQTATISTAFAQAAEGIVHFHVEVRVDMKEFAGWQPERISAFFSGIAQVLAAKSQIEGGSTK